MFMESNKREIFAKTLDLLWEIFNELPAESESENYSFGASSSLPEADLLLDNYPATINDKDLATAIMEAFWGIRSSLSDQVRRQSRIVSLGLLVQDMRYGRWSAIDLSELGM